LSGKFHHWRQGLQADWPVIANVLHPVVMSNARLKRLMHAGFMRQ
jgi:hypothetical protein